MKERLIFVDFSSEEEVSELSINFENGNIIRMNKISTKNFMNIYEAIYEVKAKYNPKVLSQLRRDIYELAKEEEPKGKIVVTGFENLDSITPDMNFLLGVGVQKNGHIIKSE